MASLIFTVAPVLVWPVLSLVLAEGEKKKKKKLPHSLPMLVDDCFRAEGRTGAGWNQARDIMWPRRWLHCVPWPSCAAQLCWRTCGLDRRWDRSRWFRLPWQDLRRGCPCASVPCGCCRGWARPGSRSRLRGREGGVACKRGPGHKAQHSPALATLRCCSRSTTGSGSKEIKITFLNCHPIALLFNNSVELWMKMSVVVNLQEKSPTCSATVSFTELYTTFLQLSNSLLWVIQSQFLVTFSTSLSSSFFFFFVFRTLKIRRNLYMLFNKKQTETFNSSPVNREKNLWAEQTSISHKRRSRPQAELK